MIPIVNLKAQHAALRGDLIAAIERVVDSCQFCLGSEVEAFEQGFASYCTTRSGIGVNSGTSALHLALLAAGIGPGDEVITVPFTFVATVASVLYAGARPVLVDIDPDSFTIDVRQIEKAITPRTKAILPVHLYGQPADMDPILEIARRRNLTVIEDAAQAHGAEYKGRKVGSLGSMGCFSFYPGKNLGACGEGGMIVTDNPDHSRTLKILRDWGADRKYHHVVKGFNYRMEGMQGAVLGVKLKHLDDWTRARQAHASLYDRLLAGLPLQTPKVMPYASHVYHLYVVRTPQRDRLQTELQQMGIQTALHYPVPVHLQPAYADLGYRVGDFPHAEKAAAEVLSIPMHPELTPGQVESVAAALRDLLRR